MSNLSDIGFPVKSEQDVNSVIETLLKVVKPTNCAGGAYFKYSDESGAEMYLQSNLQDELIGFNPHFTGKSRRIVGITKSILRDSSELDGGFHAWANPRDENDVEHSGDYPFVFDVPDFRTVGEIDFPQAVEIQLTAFASNDFKVFQSEENYYASQIDEPKFAANFFIPSGLFLPDEEMTPIEPPRPIGTFAGEIKEFAPKTNSLTGEDFYWFLVETLGGEIDVVADAKLVSEEPNIGGIVSGQFWLSGRILSSPKQEKSNLFKSLIDE